MTEKQSYCAPCTELAAYGTYAALAASSGVNVDDYTGDIWGDEVEW